MIKVTASMMYSGITALSALLLVSGWSLGFSGGVHYLETSKVELATVQSGEFTQRVSGYGSLQSQNQRLITAGSTAIIDEIKLRPGAVVEADTVLLRLKNPALESAMQQAMAALHNSRTTKRKLVLEQQREILEQESRLSELKADNELASLQVEAEAPLAAAGIISDMEARRSKLKANQMRERYKLEQEKMDKLHQVHAEYLLLQDESIQQFEADFNSAKYQLEQLVVRAGLAGVLQRMPVSLGQSVTIGDELALVGSLSPLVAEIKVPQMQVSLLQHGAKADIDTRHGVVSGQVIRIDPVVADGAVQVDILLPDNLSSDIRPMQMVDAKIYGQSRGLINFIDKPALVAEDSKLEVFKLDQTQLATKVSVQFGKIAGNQIEVVSGLVPGDRIIISSMAVDRDVSRVQLTQ